MGRGVASAVHVPPLLPASATHRRTPSPPRKAPILLVFDMFVKLCQSEFVDADAPTERVNRLVHPLFNNVADGVHYE